MPYGKNEEAEQGTFMSCGIIKKVKIRRETIKRCILMVCIAEIFKAAAEIGKIILAAWITVKHVHNWRNYAVIKKYTVLKQLLCLWQGAVFAWYYIFLKHHAISCDFVFSFWHTSAVFILPSFCRRRFRVSCFYIWFGWIKAWIS